MVRSFLHNKITCKYSSLLKAAAVLMSPRSDLCLLLFVLRLGGWLKQFNLVYLINQKTALL